MSSRGVPPPLLQSHSIEGGVARTSEVLSSAAVGGAGARPSTACPRPTPPDPACRAVDECGTSAGRQSQTTVQALAPPLPCAASGLGASPSQGPGSVPISSQSLPTAPGTRGHLGVAASPAQQSLRSRRGPGPACCLLWSPRRQGLSHLVSTRGYAHLTGFASALMGRWRRGGALGLPSVHGGPEPPTPGLLWARASQRGQ